jgi:hypothetical protein
MGSDHSFAQIALDRGRDGVWVDVPLDAVLHLEPVRVCLLASARVAAMAADRNAVSPEAVLSVERRPFVKVLDGGLVSIDFPHVHLA